MSVNKHSSQLQHTLFPQLRKIQDHERATKSLWSRVPGTQPCISTFSTYELCNHSGDIYFFSISDITRNKLCAAVRKKSLFDVIPYKVILITCIFNMTLMSKMRREKTLATHSLVCLFCSSN